MVVRPDGKVSLCCNDALGTMTLGDLTKELSAMFGMVKTTATSVKKLHQADKELICAVVAILCYK